MAKSKRNLDSLEPEPVIFAGGHHARLIDEAVPYHIISRVFQGRHLLRPEAELNDLVLGVIGRAQELFPNVELYAFAFMSNHFHAMARGVAGELPFFVGYIKREISRRFGERPDINWPGTMWHEYLATALPTEDSQVQCLRYILAQGTKENLVERPQDWPGAHCVKALMLGRKLEGSWLDATSYLRARQHQARKRAPQPVKKADYLSDYEVKLTPIPAWRSQSDAQRRTLVHEMVQQICKDARDERASSSRRVVGIKAVLRTPRSHRTELPHIPWFERRQRMICWAPLSDERVRAFLEQYWTFQLAFRAAAARLREGDDTHDFPIRAFRPVQYCA